MSGPVFEGIEFGDGLDLAVSEFVARENAELVSGPEGRDRHHEGAGERESVALSECKILCHVRNLRPERADPARWLRQATGICSAATGTFLIGNRLDDFEVHLGTRFDAGDFAGNLGPMPVFTAFPCARLRSALRCAS
jgi:hypothetical protein